MSSLQVKPPQARTVPGLYVVVGVVLFAAALAASLGAKPSVRVTVDGTPRRLEAGATISDLKVIGYLKSRPGRVRSAVSGRLLAQHSGDEVRVWRNDRLATDDQTVYDGDVITSVSGRDVVEETVLREEQIPAPVKTVGSGPLMAVSSPGSPGLRQVTVGAISGEAVSSVVLTQPSETVVTRYSKHVNKKVVALTFDDGPWPGQTDRILAILKQYKVKATFFMLGYLVKKNPSLARRVVSGGHVVGNHTMGHRKLTELSPAAVDQQIAGAEAAILSSTGTAPVWFRPPGGYISPAVWSRAREADLRVALWNVDPQDWRRPPAAQIQSNVISHVRPGSIVLLHDGGGNRTQTIAALPTIIKSLRAQGYEFVTVDEISKR